jgi:NADPH-dependent ferric siderophore reductase
MGSDHGTGHGHDDGRALADAGTGNGARDGAGTTDAGGADLASAVERYRAAAERYSVAKYEYKAAKYALKATRLRAGQDPKGRRGHGHHHGHREHHGKYGRRRYDDRLPDLGSRDEGEPRLDGVDHDRERRGRRQVVLEVVATERIGEHIQRLTLGGDGFEDFRDNDYTDKYVKILFVDPALGLQPPYDIQALRKTLPKHQRPVRRTYTVHSVDTTARTLVIDFVVHGDSGVAGPWASRAQVGDQVAFSGPGGKYAPDARADWHLLVGDTAALPAISAALAALPADAVGAAFIEVPGPSDEWDLEAPPGVDVRWLHRGMGERVPSPLPGAVQSMQWKPGRVQAFVHGEKAAVKSLRRHLLEDRGVDRRMLSLSSYWSRGSSGD